jgi:hypothetical protein
LDFEPLIQPLSFISVELIAYRIGSWGLGPKSREMEREVTG